MYEEIEYDEYIRPGTRESVFAALDLVPDRALDVLVALRAGRISGFWYWGGPDMGHSDIGTGCLLCYLSGSAGKTISPQVARSNMVACGLREVHGGYTDTPVHIMPAEQLFLTIRPGDTPTNNKYCRYAEKCITEWMRMRGKSGPEEIGANQNG